MENSSVPCLARTSGASFAGIVSFKYCCIAIILKINLEYGSHCLCLCRLGSSGMCYSHFKYLMQIYELLGERKYNVNVIILSNLLSRQYTFLSDKDKIDFIDGIVKSSDPHRWNQIARILDPQKKIQLQQQVDVSAVNSGISTNLRTLEEQPTLTNLFALVRYFLMAYIIVE